ncbi:Ankyrin repeat and SAM domain-containing protein 1A [Bienertia sinuspersici]
MRVKYRQYGLPLYKAAIQGDWEAARQIYSMYPHCFATTITKGGDTALHIAAVARRIDFVEQLVKLLVQENCTHLLAVRNNIGNTALCLAATSGSVKIARLMIDADINLLKMPGNASGLTPLHMAALLGKREMVNYLLWHGHTQNFLTHEQRCDIFISTINSDLYDVALDLLLQHGELIMARDDETRETPLHSLL